MPARYIEDIETGEVAWTLGRTITESDVFAFSGLSGDYHPVHTDFEMARASAFGRPIAQGQLVLILATGLCGRDGSFDDSIIALLGVEWKFLQPVFFGDTIRGKITVLEARRTSKGDKGILVRGLEIFNQRDEVVQTGKLTHMVKARASA